MYSKYINNIQLREQSREPIIGGVPLPMFFNTSNEVFGGNKLEGIKKIAHLSVPVGLVITPHKLNSSYMTSKISNIDDDKIIDELLFNKLYYNTSYKTSKRKTYKKR